MGADTLGVEITFYEAELATDARLLCKEMRHLIGELGVNLVLNFRNEDIGHSWNQEFAKLQGALKEYGIEGLSLLDQYTGSDPYIQCRWAKMLETYGITPEWSRATSMIRSLVKSSNHPIKQPVLVVCTCSSREDKAVKPHVWADVVARVKSVLAEIKVHLVAGLEAWELRVIHTLHSLLGNQSISATIRQADNLHALATELARGTVVAANDSFPMHLSYALGRPTVGLYSVTNRAIWGPPNGRHFIALTSDACKMCCGVMPAQGVCWEQSACPSPPNSAWNSFEIAERIIGLFKQEMDQESNMEVPLADCAELSSSCVEHIQ